MVLLFLLSSLLLVWRLEAMSEKESKERCWNPRHALLLRNRKPDFCSGFGEVGRPGAEVVTNSIVNNVTNMTVLLGLPALFWGLEIEPGREKISNEVKRNSREHIVRCC